MLCFIKNVFTCSTILWISFIHLHNCFYVISQTLTPNLPPEIIKIASNVEYKVFKSGEKLELICRGREKVKWAVPTKRPDALSELNPVDKYYYANLTISKAVYNDTGEYICQYLDNDELESRSIYVYVQDGNHLFLPRQSPDIVGFPNQHVTIPCRATCPTTKVYLKRNGLEVPNVLYDPQEGFTVYLNGTCEAAVYTCYALNQYFEIALRCWPSTTTSEMPSSDHSQQFATANNSSAQEPVLTTSTISPDKFNKSADGNATSQAHRGKFKATLIYCVIIISIINFN